MNTERPNLQVRDNFVSPSRNAKIEWKCGKISSYLDEEKTKKKPASLAPAARLRKTLLRLG